VRAPVEEEPFVLSAGPSPSERLATAGEAPSRLPSRTKIELAQTRHVPLVHATVAGRPTLLLLDTGSFDHLLEGWFGRALQDTASGTRSAALVDHANRRVPVERYSEASFAVDGWEPLPSIRPLVTNDLTPAPRKLGIGGILSPQRLVRGNVIVIDFPQGEMVSGEPDDGAGRLRAHATSLGTALRCGGSYVVDATIEGQDARLVVDTGSYLTDLKIRSSAGQALSGRSSVAREVYAIGGAVATRAITDARLAVGDLRTKLDVALIEDQASRGRCAGDGVVGMDVLAQCVLVIDDQKMRIACG
jgi:hypothetical protein